MSMRFYVNRTDYLSKVEIRFGDREKALFAKPVEFATSDPGLYVEPSLTATDEQGQQLMDALWDAGYRPTQGHGSAGQFEATAKHLEDMRKIAFNKLKME